jgi:transposase InsO family protein
MLLQTGHPDFSVRRCHITAARQGLERYITQYNQIRPHSSLDRVTPDEFYFVNLLPIARSAQAESQDASLKT